jgi:hypothetical protein
MQDCDILIDHMLVKKFLDKVITANAYKVQVYVKPGALSRRIDEGDKLQIQLPRTARNNHRAREGGRSRADGKRKNADVEDVVEDYGGEGGEADRVERLDNVPESSSAKRRRRSSHQQHHASSSAIPAAALEMDFDDSHVEVNADEDSEYESEDLGWKSNLRGAPAVAHRTLRNKSSAQGKAGVASRPSGASEANVLPIYDDEVIDISSE